LGAGFLDWDSNSESITIRNTGTFTISEDGGDGATVTFRVTPGILFGDPFGGNGWGYEDSIFTYEEVFLLGGTTVVGATVTISEIGNLVDDEFMLDGGPRDAGGGLGSYISPDDSTLESFAEFTIAFHAAGDPNTPIPLNNISVTIKDIDNEQYVAAENVDSYSLSATPPTELSARTVGTTLFVEELDGDGSRTQDEEHWAVLNFNSASTITMRVGSRDGDGALFNSLFAVAEWSSAPATITTGSSSPAAPVSTAAPRLLAATGAKVEWLVVTGLLVAIAGSGLLVSSRRKRIW
jgi:LPXTG-motif cell wall-anchored protein